MSSGGSNSKTWKLKIQATSSTLTGAGCTTPIPVSALSVTCSNATAPATGGGTATCASTFKLGTTAKVFVSGTEATGSNQTYSAVLTFGGGPDKWKYAGTDSAGCSLTINYLAVFP